MIHGNVDSLRTIAEIDYEINELEYALTHHLFGSRMFNNLTGDINLLHEEREVLLKELDRKQQADFNHIKDLQNKGLAK